MIEYIRKTIPTKELLAQLAEEAAELGHAALKVRRTLDNTNPTPVTSEEAFESLHEEIADIKLVLKALGLDTPNTRSRHTCIMQGKVRRWCDRLGHSSFDPDSMMGEYEEENE